MPPRPPTIAADALTLSLTQCGQLAAAFHALAYLATPQGALDRFVPAGSRLHAWLAARKAIVAALLAENERVGRPLLRRVYLNWATATQPSYLSTSGQTRRAHTQVAFWMPVALWAYGAKAKATLQLRRSGASASSSHWADERVVGPFSVAGCEWPIQWLPWPAIRDLVERELAAPALAVWRLHLRRLAALHEPHVGAKDAVLCAWLRSVAATGLDAAPPGQTYRLTVAEPSRDYDLDDYVTEAREHFDLRHLLWMAGAEPGEYTVLPIDDPADWPVVFRPPSDEPADSARVVRQLVEHLLGRGRLAPQDVQVLERDGLLGGARVLSGADLPEPLSLAVGALEADELARCEAEAGAAPPLADALGPARSDPSGRWPEGRGKGAGNRPDLAPAVAAAVRVLEETKELTAVLPALFAKAATLKAAAAACARCDAATLATLVATALAARPALALTLYALLRANLAAHWRRLAGNATYLPDHWLARARTKNPLAGALPTADPTVRLVWLVAAAQRALLAALRAHQVPLTALAHADRLSLRRTLTAGNLRFDDLLCAQLVGCDPVSLLGLYRDDAGRIGPADVVTGEVVRYLAVHWPALKHVARLDLAWTAVHGTGCLVGFEVLTSLRLQGCALDPADRNPTVLASLRTLDLSATTGPLDWLDACPQLRALDLSERSDLQYLPSEVGRLAHLETLNLAGNIELRGLSILAHLPKLQSLVLPVRPWMLDDRMLDPIGHVPEVVCESAAVVAVHRRARQRFVARGGHEAALLAGGSQLRAGNWLWPPEGHDDAGVVYAIDLLRDRGTLDPLTASELDLSHHWLGHGEALRAFYGLRKFKAIGASWKSLDGLQQCSELRELDLSWPTEQPRGRQLAGLRQLDKLERLALRGWHGPLGTLPALPALQELDLRRATDIRRVPDAKAFPALRLLRLSHCYAVRSRTEVAALAKTVRITCTDLELVPVHCRPYLHEET